MSWVNRENLYRMVRAYARRPATSLTDEVLNDFFQLAVEELVPSMRGRDQLWYDVRDWTPNSNDFKHPQLGYMFGVPGEPLEILHILREHCEHLYTPWERMREQSYASPNKLLTTIGPIRTDFNSVETLDLLLSSTKAWELGYQCSIKAVAPAYFSVQFDSGPERYYAPKGQGYSTYMVEEENQASACTLRAYNTAGTILETNVFDISGIIKPQELVNLEMPAKNQLPSSPTCTYSAEADGVLAFFLYFDQSQGLPGSTEVEVEMQIPGYQSQKHTVTLDSEPVQFLFNTSIGIYTPTIFISRPADPAINKYRRYDVSAIDTRSGSSYMTYDQIRGSTIYQPDPEIDPNSVTEADTPLYYAMAFNPQPEVGKIYDMDIGLWIKPVRIVGTTGETQLLKSAEGIFMSRMLEEAMRYLAWDERAPVFAAQTTKLLNSYNEDGRKARESLTKRAVTQDVAAFAVDEV